MENEGITSVKSILTFRIADELFAVNVLNVLKILEMTEITKVPQAPEFMKGVINLHGSVLPVIDLRQKLDLPLADFTRNTCILVFILELDSDEINVGAIVDNVDKVTEIDTSTIQPSPSIGTKYASEFIKGVAKLNDEFVMILDVNKIIGTDDIVSIKDTVIEK